MKYLLMIYGNDEKWAAIPPADFAAGIAKQEAFNSKYAATGELLGAYGLGMAATAKLVRRTDGLPAVTDGPYLEAKEHFASFYLLDCASETRAAEIAADMPWADESPVELWPVPHESPINQAIADLPPNREATRERPRIAEPSSVSRTPAKPTHSARGFNAPHPRRTSAGYLGHAGIKPDRPEWSR